MFFKFNNYYLFFCISSSSKQAPYNLYNYSYNFGELNNFVVRKTSFFKSILSNNFFVFTGLISYSLYLWHYPVFSFSRHIFINTDFENNIILKLFLIVISIILSLISYFFIEKFFRFKNKSLKALFYLFFYLP